jgi:hypothetical protein
VLVVPVPVDDVAGGVRLYMGGHPGLVADIRHN